jgi:hypothetical protein
VAVSFAYSLANHFDLAPVLSEGRVVIPMFDEKAKTEREALKKLAEEEEAKKKAADAAPAK